MYIQMINHSLDQIKSMKSKTIFDYFDKSLIVLSAQSGIISIASFATVVGTPVRIASTSLSVTFSFPTGIVKKTVQNNKK